MTNAGSMQQQAKRAKTVGNTSGGMRIRVVKAKKSANKFFPKSAHGIELKQLTSQKTLSLVTTDGSNTISVLNTAIAQGTDTNQRIGSQINIKSILFQGQVAVTSAVLAAAPYIAAGGTDTVRVCVFVDKQANGNTLLTPTNVYDNTGAAGGVFSGRTQEYLERYDVLYEEKFNINQGGPTGFSFSKYIKCDIPVKYVNSSGLTPLTNAIYAFVQCSTGNGTVGPICSYNAKVVFSDD